MPETYKKMFFEKMRIKFLKELSYLNDETMYKIIWSFFKGNALTVNKKNKDWEAVKQVLAKKSKDINPQIMADLLVLATKEEQEAKD